MNESVELGKDGHILVSSFGVTLEEALEVGGRDADIWLREHDGKYPLSLSGIVTESMPDHSGKAVQVTRVEIEVALGPDAITALKAYFFDH